jgi:hypothetical protein
MVTVPASQEIVRAIKEANRELGGGPPALFRSAAFLTLPVAVGSLTVALSLPGGTLASLLGICAAALVGTLGLAWLKMRSRAGVGERHRHRDGANGNLDLQISLRFRMLRNSDSVYHGRTGVPEHRIAGVKAAKRLDQEGHRSASRRSG